MYQKLFKRLLDIVISLLGIVILSPILLIIAISIKTTSKGAVLFKQERTGKDNVPFQILKFRSMRINTPKDIPTHMLENPEEYITRVGNLLRKTSLDELPQLWNIFIGDMSIIGPRPSLTTQYDLNVLRDENGSSSIKPGLTGLAQIKGRDELAIEVKAEIDGDYYQHITFLGDIRIFLKTIGSVLKSDGVQEGKS